MTNNQTRTEICPECKSDKITFLLWGLPAFSDELEKRIDKGEVELRGCCVDPHSKQFRCNNCNFEWGKV